MYHSYDMKTIMNMKIEHCLNLKFNTEYDTNTMQGVTNVTEF